MASNDVPNPLEPSLLPRLDPEFVSYYNRTTAIKLATHQVPLAEVRANPAAWSGPGCKDFTGTPGVDNVSIQSADGHQVPLRIYTPQDHAAGPFPVHVNFHGGGFVFGRLTADAEFCMKLRNELGILVVDVDYRLQPEHRFGKQFEDGWAAFMWMRDNAAKLDIKPDSISVGGISAGGHLAAVMQHMARDADIPMKLAVLSVPTTDYTTYFPFPPGAEPFPSVKMLANAPDLTAARLAYFQEHVNQLQHQEYIWKEMPVTWRTPLHAPNFRDLCDTFIATAEIDPLVDEGEAYGMKIVAAGGRVAFRRYLGVPHTFTHLSAYLAKSRQYQADLCAALKASHSF